VSDVTDKAKRELEDTKRSIQDAKDQLGQAMREVGGPPAEDEDQAVRQIEALRGQLDRDLATLRDRIPDGQEVLERYGERLRTVGIAVAGGTATLWTVTTAIRRRRAESARAAVMRAQAIAIAREIARLDPEELAPEVGGRRGRAFTVVAGVAIAGAAAVARNRAREQEMPDLWGSPMGPPPHPELMAGAVDVTEPTSAEPGPGTSPRRWQDDPPQPATTRVGGGGAPGTPVADEPGA
jgi:hypothetical protein